MSTTLFNMKRNDLIPAITAILLDADGAPVNLAGISTVRFLMRDRAKVLKINSPAVIVTPAAGTVRYDWAPGDTNTAGLFQAEWELTYPSGKIETFPNDSWITCVFTEDVDITVVPDAVLVTITDLVSTLQIALAALEVRVTALEP